VKKLCLILVLLLVLSGCTPSVTPTEPSATGGTAAPTVPATDPTQTPVPSEPTTPAATNAPTVTPTAPPATAAPTEAPGCTHADSNEDGKCDLCSISVIVSFDIYAINDLHGKADDGDNHPGVDELSTYLKNARKDKDNVIVLSSGDMWQGSAESNMTKGLLITDWMNELDFAAMTIGNHEYDWGQEPIAANDALAEFPFLAINIYDRATKRQVSYCQSSVMVDADGIQIGIIGAIGDCYSSIASDKCADVYFKTGTELTRLVKAESDRLRSQGADFIIYSIHDGYGGSTGSSVSYVSSGQLASYYDLSLSNGYVDLVFEAHTHQRYVLLDDHGVYHLQNGGDNTKGISHATVSFNLVSGNSKVEQTELVSTSQYSSLPDDPIVDDLLEKYADMISPATKVLGNNWTRRDSDYLRQLCADLYYQEAVEYWGQKYDIVLAGAFMSVRSPYYLARGDVTYGMLQQLFPFDNQLVLCTIKGRDLKTRFFDTDDDRYFISYGDYGQQVKNNLDPNATYYIVTDTYSSTYSPNRLTEVERYKDNIFARDLLADYVAEGGMERKT